MFVRQRQKCDLECEVWPQTYAAITTWLVWLVAFLLQLWGKNKPEESFINLWIWFVWYEDIYLSFLMPIKFLSTVHSFLRVCWSIRTLSVLTCYDIKVVHPSSLLASFHLQCLNYLNPSIRRSAAADKSWIIHSALYQQFYHLFTSNFAWVGWRWWWWYSTQISMYNSRRCSSTISYFRKPNILCNN